MKLKEVLLEERKPAKQPPIKEVRLAIQSGNVDVPTGFALRSAFKKIILKHATGPQWELKRHFLDSGLYYTGNDMQEMQSVVSAIIGDLYGFFQDGPKREITRVVRSEDTNSVTYTVKPMGGAPQIEFFHNKQPGADGAVLGALINPKR